MSVEAMVMTVAVAEEADMAVIVAVASLKRHPLKDDKCRFSIWPELTFAANPLIWDPFCYFSQEFPALDSATTIERNGLEKK